MQMLAELARIVTTAPWTLSRSHHERFRSAGLSDDDVLHAVIQSAFFGHLNRIADAAAVPLDYEVRELPPPADPRIPSLAPATTTIAGRPAIELQRRPPTTAALFEWRTYLFDRDAPLTRRHRTLIARWAALWLGDASISSPDDLTATPIDNALRALAERVTLAPWQLDDEAYAPLRDAGFADRALFDVVATASTAGMFSRIEVALVALGRSDRAAA